MAPGITIVVGAVDELLLTEAHQLPCGAIVLSLYCTCCTECPGRLFAVCALVFHLYDLQI